MTRCIEGDSLCPDIVHKSRPLSVLMFRHEVPIEVGEVVSRDRFVFADLILADK